MPGIVVWKWKLAKSPHATGGSISTSSLLGAFNERLKSATIQSDGMGHFFEAALIAALVIPVASGPLGCNQQSSRMPNLLS